MDDYKLVESEQVVEGRKFSVYQDTIEYPGGFNSKQLWISHPGASVILPLEKNGDLIFVKQYRHPFKAMVLEFPAGTLDPGEDPLECAKREVCEEAGVAAREWKLLGKFHTAPGYSNEVQYGYLATDLYPHSLPGDPDEVIEVVKMSPAQVEKCIASGDIVDVTTLAVYYSAKYQGYFN